MPPIVVVAARNEAETIGETLGALGRAFPGAAVWVADDGSDDATAQIARDAGAVVVSTGSDVGKGAAMTSALERALASIKPLAPAPATCVVLLCDGDLGDSAELLGALVHEVREGRADVAVAAFARSLGGGFGLARGFARWAIARRCGLQTHAPISGQRALNARALDAVLPLAGGFGMEIGMTIDAVRAGCRLREVELHLAHRATGRTPAGFAHRARQLVDFVRVYWARR